MKTALRGRMLALAAITMVLLWRPATPVQAMQFGVFGGTLNESGTTLVGLTLDSGFLVPMLKLETEAYLFTASERTGKVLTIGLKLRPDFGRIAPYAVAGVGTELQRLDISQAKDRYFTFIGGGVVVGLAAVVSLRLDLRFQQHGKRADGVQGDAAVHYVRFTAGVIMKL